MSEQSSTKLSDSQSDSTLLSKIGSRLREERQRVVPHQGRFAERIGITQGKLSHLEMGRSEAKAEDLAAVAKAGVDIHYVLTGERLNLEALDDETRRCLADYLALPDELRPIARGILGTMLELGGRRA